MKEIKFSFASNRAEEYDNDCWGTIVLPYYFDDLEFGHQKKPLRFIGGRGSGKTTLLKFLSHRSQFSPNRTDIPASVTKNIGIYYKAENTFLSLFEGQGFNEKNWQTIFQHQLCLSITEEILDFTRRIISNPAKYSALGSCPETITFHHINDFDDSLPLELDDLITAIRSKRNRLASWINNIDIDTVQPRTYPHDTFLNCVITAITEQISFLKSTTFHVLIDEYETLSDYQQRCVNSLIKGANNVLTYHIAMKMNGMNTRHTLTKEDIQEEADFRTVYIEQRLKDNFELFCAELFYFRLIQSGYKTENTPIDPDLMKDPQRIAERYKDVGYKRRVLSQINQTFPGRTPSEQADYIFEDEVLFKRLKNILSVGINNKEKSVDPESFIDKNFAAASVTSAALVYQNKMPSELLIEFKKLTRGENSKYKEWIHKYLNGTLFLLWEPLSQRDNQMYCGFKTFVAMSKLNIRHFLELGHLSISKLEDNSFSKESLIVSQELQAKAAHETGGYFYEETKSSGLKGNRLFSVVETIGRIFQLSQGRNSQSEFERTHFSISTGQDQLSEESLLVLQEAIKWSVFIVEEETKVKKERLESYEYTLNPIYSPHFKISYRKGRKLELLGDQAESLFAGNKASLEALVDAFAKQWVKDDKNSHQSQMDLDA